MKRARPSRQKNQTRPTAARGSSETAYDKFKKAGLIGMIRGTKRDLSTNPSHFDGFGS